jgi:hypothetical protein
LRRCLRIILSRERRTLNLRVIFVSFQMLLSKQAANGTERGPVNYREESMVLLVTVRLSPIEEDISRLHTLIVD